MDPHSLSRRHVLAAGLGAAAAGLAGCATSGAAETRTGADRRRALRVAHLTDVHIQPERRAGEGLAACLDHLRAQSDRPELVLLGGDCVFDSFGADATRTKTQWDLFRSVMRDGCTLPVHGAIGNHDIWGWNKKESKSLGTEALYGKAMAVEMLGLPAPHYSFDHGGWHFVVLDSIRADEKKEAAYIAALDDAQFEWLDADLARVPAGVHTLVLSHAPILSATCLYQARDAFLYERKVSASLMHGDAYRLADLFLKRPTVKACISGHVHQIDRVDYQGVSYFCNGAVCANWWKGPYYQCHEGYSLVDLYADGSCERAYIPYGWHAAPA